MLDAVVFKIYVVGTTNRLVKRSSLHEACKLDDGTGLWPLERVSCASVSQDLDQDAFASEFESSTWTGFPFGLFSLAIVITVLRVEV